MTASKNLIQASAGNAAGGSFYDYEIENSARFNLPDVPELSKTFGTATNRKKWTYSTWAKIADTTRYKFLFFAGTTDANYTHFAVFGDYLWFLNYAGGNQISIISTAKFRDLSAWYHFVVAVDTTQASASDRVKIYVNGTQLTAFSTATLPSQNFETLFNSSIEHTIGTDAQFYTPIGGETMNGYLAEPVFVDGQQLSPTDLGEEKNGVWIPKDPSGLTFGTNGFWLDFSNSGALGTDVSGNGNNFTVSGLTSSDQMPDTPTNNFPTFNPLARVAGEHTFSDGNMVDQHTCGLAEWHTICGTIALPSTGKYYWETSVTTGIYLVCGLVKSTYQFNSMPATGYQYIGLNTELYNQGFGYTYSGDTRDSTSGSSVAVATGTTFTTNDVIGIAVDMDNKTIAFYKNNTLVTTLTPNTFTDDDLWVPAFSTYNVNDVVTVNFGQLGFTYTPPTGFVALSTANFPEPTIGPNSAILTSEVFEPILYTGNGTSQSISTLDFQPDFTWIKNRDAADNHMLFDAVRGATKYLSSNTANAEVTDAQTLSSFNTNGFSVGNNVAVNTNAEDYVAWNWKGNGSGVSNTDGDITSTVSANQDAGISIVTYTGNGTTGSTVGHGLGKTPSFIIAKRRDASGYSWPVWSTALSGNTYVLDLQTTDAERVPTDAFWTPQNNTSSVFGLGFNSVSNYSGSPYVAYCFAEVEGFSKFGSWAGVSGSEFIYTGFRPAFVLVKRTNTSGWYIFDNKRGYNGGINGLQPNTSGADSGPWATQFNLYSNGFEDNNYVGDAGTTIIYMAFAENPFKYSNAR